MNFTKTENSETINNLRSKLYQKLTAPIDAMWNSFTLHHLNLILLKITIKYLGTVVLITMGV